MQYRSQCGQDRYVVETLFPGLKFGTFLDIGAYDGITLSNTYALETELGWTGLCIEPIPEVFKKLQINRKCIVEQGCASAQDGELELLHVDGPSEMLSGITASYDPKHLVRVDHEIRTLGGLKRHIKVPSLAITPLLERHNLRKIDYCSLDTEGSEFDIVKAIDFSKISIACFTIENNYHDRKIRDYLTSKGYRLVTVLGCDDVFSMERI